MPEMQTKHPPLTLCLPGEEAARDFHSKTRKQQGNLKRRNITKQLKMETLWCTNNLELDQKIQNKLAFKKN